MALIVEDGTGIIDADSYVSIEELDNYALKFGKKDWTESIDTDSKEIAARNGSAYIDLRYMSLLTGYKLNTEQGLEFPRVGFVYYNGTTNTESVINGALKKAAMEATFYSFGGIDLMPDLESGPNVISKKLANGAVETQWDKDSFGKLPVFRKIEALLYPMFGEMPDPTDTTIMRIIPIERV